MLCVPFQPVSPCPRLAAAVTLRTVRAEDRGAAQVPPQSALRDGGEPGGREGVGRRTPQRAGIHSALTPSPVPAAGAAAGAGLTQRPLCGNS